jgi:arginase
VVFVDVLGIDAEADARLVGEVSGVLAVAFGLSHRLGECLPALVGERSATSDRDVMQVVIRRLPSLITHEVIANGQAAAAASTHRRALCPPGPHQTRATYPLEMASLALIAWPYHAGLADVSMGLGASTLLADERLLSAVRQHGGEVTCESVPPVDEALPEVARIFELDRRLALRVAEARQRHQFPLVLAGNCVSCLGTTAGVRGGRDLGVVWLDAHADFDTPEDNLSGFTDVMGLSILTCGCWRALRETIPGFEAVEERNVAIAGVRDLEPYQRGRLAASAMGVVEGAVDLRRLRRLLNELSRQVQRVYLHVDLDVLDVSVGRANPYAASGGPDVERVLSSISETFSHFKVEAAALTAYDPRVDTTAGIAAAAREIAGQIAAGAREQAEI